ncbi:MAG: copper-binding protein [Motiliproteus sp.]
MMIKNIKRTSTAVVLSGLFCGSLSSGSLMAQSHDDAAKHDMKAMPENSMSEEKMSGHDMSTMKVSKGDRSKKVSAKGVIKGIDNSSRKIKVHHQPIAAWKMGAMQMTFELTSDVDMSTLKAGKEIHFMVHSPSTGKYIISEIKPH